MKLEEGKFYKTRDGTRVGPAKRGNGWQLNYKGCLFTYWYDGGYGVFDETPYDIISEWTDEPEVATQSPIRTVTKKELVPGVYGQVWISEREDGLGLSSIQMKPTLDPSELRAAADIFTQIADYLEDKE